MAGKEYSAYQRDVISKYYDNLDTIMLTRLQELVSQLYLAGGKARQAQLWDRVHKAMMKLKVKPAIIEHIMSKKDVVILAKNLEDWLAASNRPRSK
jgi:4-alpha-glucanotransferase